MTPDRVEQPIATVLGMFAILFWGSTVAFARSLAEQLGVLTSACCIYLITGTVGCMYVLSRGEARRALKGIPWRYWAGCGGFFSINIVCFHLAVGMASGRQAVIEVGLINYLWISLTLLLSVPLLKKKPTFGLVPGMALAGTGIVIASLQSGPVSWEVFRENLRGNSVSYVLAFAGALAWALYSNLNRRWSRDGEGWAIPVFLLAVGLILAVMRSTVSETTHWSPQVGAELAYMIVFPTLLAYVFWDTAMRKGAMVFVVSFSYLTPLLSTLVNCGYLHIAPRPGLWVACALVVGGAALCRRSIRD